MLILNSGLNWHHRDLSFRMTTILGTNAVMLQTIVTIPGISLGYTKVKGVLWGHTVHTATVPWSFIK